MDTKKVLSGFLFCLVLIAAFVAACTGGSSQAGPMGTVAVVIRDGTVQSSDGRTVTSVFIEISRITLRSEEEDDDDDEHEDGDHQPMSDDGDDDDEHEDDEHEDDDDEHEDDEIEVVVFDMFRDNGGVPREVDLLTLTDSGMLLNMLRIPVGTYQKARVTLIGATAIFEDDATQTPVALVLDGDSESGSVFKVEFDPPVEVSESGTSVAAIDIVPVITLDGGSYELSNDRDSDQSGECGDGELEVEIEGTITAVNGLLIQLGNIPLDIDLSGVAPVLVMPGMEVEVSGFFENGVLVATEFEIED